MNSVIKNIRSPKLIVAILTAASFFVMPAISQAGDKHQTKKAEHMMDKKKEKMEKHEHDMKEKMEKGDHDMKDKKEKQEEHDD